MVNMSRLAGKKVIICDDNALNIELARYYLEEMQMETAGVLGGQRAIELFQQNPPYTFDAIILDIRMPVMDGIRAAKKIRQMGRKDSETVAILAMSADMPDGIWEELQEAGIDDLLLKPLIQEELEQKLLRITDGRS